MPSKSASQHRLMAAVAHNPSFAKKVGIPQSVGRDFTEADKGRKFAKGGDMAKKLPPFMGKESKAEEAKEMKIKRMSPALYKKGEKAEGIHGKSGMEKPSKYAKGGGIEVRGKTRAQKFAIGGGVDMASPQQMMPSQTPLPASGMKGGPQVFGGAKPPVFTDRFHTPTGVSMPNTGMAQPVDAAAKTRQAYQNLRAASDMRRQQAQQMMGPQRGFPTSGYGVAQVQKPGGTYQAGSAPRIMQTAQVGIAGQGGMTPAQADAENKRLSAMTYDQRKAEAESRGGSYEGMPPQGYKAPNAVMPTDEQVRSQLGAYYGGNTGFSPSYTPTPMKKGGVAKFAKGGFTREADGVAQKGKTKAQSFAKGGSIDGCATKGKTKCRYI